VEISDGPSAIRFPKGIVYEDLPAIGHIGGADVLFEGEDKDVLLIAAGSMAIGGVHIAERLVEQGIHVTVVDPRWIKPLDAALIEAAADYKLVVVVEDNGRTGAVGDAVARALRDADIDTPIRTYGIPQEFLDHASRAEILADIGLNPQDLSRDITEAFAKVTSRGTVGSQVSNR
jgi:1-deoxy-D-xylulose-5-phosphate synthase